MKPQLSKKGKKYLDDFKQTASVIQTVCPTCQTALVFAGKLTCNVCKVRFENETKFKGRSFSTKDWSE